MFHFTPHIEIKVRQTDKLPFISPLILESMRQTDEQTTFHFTPYIGIYAIQIDEQTTFYFTPQTGIYARQTDGQTTFHFTPRI